MRGLILTGPTGVGKTTIQSRLCEQHGFWTPTTCTTRRVETSEHGLICVPEREFIEAVRAGRILLPAAFGGYWYGWPEEDVAALGSGRERAVMNVRPYPALLLQGVLHGLIAVWLTVDATELHRRRSTRHTSRDDDPLVRARREAQDMEDSVYMPCFSHTCIANEQAVANLLALLK